MRTLYNLLFLIYLLLNAPHFFWTVWRRGNWRRGFSQRFGSYETRIKQAVTNRQILWLHAVSVGEVNICTQLIRAIELRAPGLTLVVSTTTTTGMGELEKKLPSHILKIYYPIDRQPWVRRAFAVLHPKAVVLVEAEIWPNFLWRARHQRVPVFLVNARISEHSHRGYKRFGVLFRPIFAAFAGVGCESEAERQRLLALGCRPEVVRVVGNLKYDAARLDERQPVDVPALLGQLGVPADAPLLVAGSTHRGEEAILADIFTRLRRRWPDLFLVVVPRHQERGREAGRDISARGVRFIYRTEITPATRRAPGEVDCLLVNTTGELKAYYAHAAAVFVGKSLAANAKGGQNPIEPAMMAKPVVFGPNMQNFESVVQWLVGGDGAFQVPDAAGLEQALGRLLEDKAFAEETGRRAQQLVRENLGSVERTVDMIMEKLEEKEVFVVPGQ